MSANIIPFPSQPRRAAPLGTAEQELKRLAALIHARMIQKGLPSTYEKALAAVNTAAAETLE